MTTILITGTTGFLGRHLSRRLHEIGVAHISTTRRKTAQEEIFVDLAAPKSFENIPRTVRTIINCAAAVPGNQQSHDPGELDGSNGFGLLNLLEHARHRNCRVIHVSSAHSPPFPGDSKRAEAASGTYETSKRAGDVLCRLYRTIHGVELSIVKPSYIYGAGMRESTVLMKFTRSALAGVPLVLTAPPSRAFNFVYVKDVVHTLIHALNGKAERYYATAETDTTLLDLAQTVTAAANPGGDILIRNPAIPAEALPAEPIPKPSLPPKFTLAAGIGDMLREMAL